jgi:GT2 family glycosyltransferase
LADFTTSESTNPVVTTLIVVTYNSADLLDDFFASLPAALEGVASHQIVVSDNASSDDSVTLARKLCPEALIVTSSVNRGYAAAINSAVAASGSTQSILVLNDDIRLGPGTVRTLVDALAAEPRAGIAVPRLVDGDGNLLLSQRRSPTVSRAFGEAILGGDRAGRHKWLGGVVQDAGAYRRSTNPTWAVGCAWLISESCWQSVGGWDEGLFMYSEDVDYALRARDAGFTMTFVPEAEAVHLVGPSHTDSRLWSMVIWNRYRLYRRRHGSVRSLLFRGGLLLNEVLRAAAGREVHAAGAWALVSKSRRPPEVRHDLTPISTPIDDQ